MGSASFQLYTLLRTLSSPLNLQRPLLGDEISISSPSITAFDSCTLPPCGDATALHAMVFEFLFYSTTVSSTAFEMK